MWDFFNDQVRTARKLYLCDEANCEIRPGDKYHYGSGKFDGCMIVQRLCVDCRLLSTELDHEYGFDEGFPLTECRQYLRGAGVTQDPIEWARDHRAARLAKAEAQRIRREAEEHAHERRSVVLADIADERDRQISEEGWSTDHDDGHVRGELATAAAVYALGVHAWTLIRCGNRLFGLFVRRVPLGEYLWPWAPRWFKPRDRRRDLVRAGALIVAELERLDRAEARQ